MAKELISVWIPGDQLLASHPALRAAEERVGKEQVRVVLIETQARQARYPYHRQKRVLILSAMRHYAALLRSNGYQVDYLNAKTIRAGMEVHLARFQPHQLISMAASEFGARQLQVKVFPSLLPSPDQVTILPNEQFLSERFCPIPASSSGKRVLMETFYRGMRRHHEVLLEPDGSPVGGQWNFDEWNRKPLPKKIDLPPPLTWEPDEITAQVIAEVEENASEITGYGRASDFHWAVTHQQAKEALGYFLAAGLPEFGPYEDAMSTRSATLFHSLLSPYLNLGLLDPLETIRAAEDAYRRGAAPLHSVEGFVRQILGWREYIYWQYWRQMPGLREANGWRAHRPLPDFFWTAKTGMNCLHHVLKRVLTDGYSHHIERLMILCNFSLLCGIDPQEVADWFMALYIDAFEWVVLPNVIGMGLNADGGQTATKPYLASASYIHRMSDYCRDCQFDRQQRTGPNACPFNFLYWNFLLTHEQTLRANPRLGPAVLGLSRIGEREREELRAAAVAFLDGLGAEHERTTLSR
jgi:deoxyribodipyrimidine photolyase-related protein